MVIRADDIRQQRNIGMSTETYIKIASMYTEHIQSYNYIYYIYIYISYSHIYRRVYTHTFINFDKSVFIFSIYYHVYTRTITYKNNYYSAQ